MSTTNSTVANGTTQDPSSIVAEESKFVAVGSVQPYTSDDENEAVTETSVNETGASVVVTYNKNELYVFVP